MHASAWVDPPGGQYGWVSLILLPRVVPAVPGRPEAPALDHPMRRLTREVASDPRSWTPKRAANVASLFDDLAPTWAARDVPERHDALRDALSRGGPFPAGTCLEVGAGTGAGYGDLLQTFSRTVSMDLAWEMLVRGPRLALRVQADGASLPVASGAVEVVALVNMLLFPQEVARVLAPQGELLWVSTLGDATPIYLSPTEVLAALPGDWNGVASSAGWGEWIVARRV